jgi:hypothetical protein
MHPLLLRTFLAAHAHRSREVFLADIRDPHLLLRQALVPASAQQHTHRIRPAAAPGEAADPVLLPLRKRPGANAFPGMVTLGRAPNNDIVLDDTRVSRFQAYFRTDGWHWRVGDPRSTNGTAVGGVPIPPDQTLPLASGSKLTLSGSVELEFLEPEALHRLLLHGQRLVVR